MKPLGLGLLLAASVHAQGPTATMADKLIAAFKTGDAKAIAVLAAERKPDPWVLADELCARGERDAARAFVKVVPTQLVGGLAKYIEEYRPAAERTKRRDLARRAFAAAEKLELPAVMRLLADVTGRRSDVTTVRLLGLKALTLFETRRFDDAFVVLARATQLARQLDWPGKVAWSLNLAASCRNNQGRLQEAVALLIEATTAAEETGQEGILAHGLLNLGISHMRMGKQEAARAYAERALALNRKSGDRQSIARGLTNLGGIHVAMGEFPTGLRYYGEAYRMALATKDPAEIAGAAVNLGNTYELFGDHTRAERYLREALNNARTEATHWDVRVRQRDAEAYALAGLAKLRAARGDNAGAAKLLRQAVVIRQEQRNPRQVAAAMESLAFAVGRAGDPEQALRIFEKAGQVRGGAPLAGMAEMYAALGQHETAAKLQLKVLESYGDDIASFGYAGVAMQAAWSLSNVGRSEDALRVSTKGVESLRMVLRGLPEQLGSSARDVYAPVFSTGTYLAHRLGRTAQLAFFLESARAGALLELLANRGALRRAHVPVELLEAERAAHEREREAQHEYRQAAKFGHRARLAAAQAGLQAARAAVVERIDAIRLARKAAADLLYPMPASLTEIQATLRPGEAMLVYGLFEDGFAMLVTRTYAGSLWLGKSKDLVEAAETLRAVEKKGAGVEIERAARRLAAATPLPPTIKRLFVSPDGPLAYVPFSMLFPGIEVVMVPSGTTYRLLRGEARARGTGVLAFGDPGEARDTSARDLMRSGWTRSALPGSRIEARAVGTRTFVGEQATETRLRAELSAKKRWRAVHLACHGLVSADDPSFSCLALADDDANDGFLTVLDVYAMQVPADLVVLSACETARGRIYRAEGVIGFTRAFMFAGAPRVIVSLWKVDDEATRALMVKFYELWKPGKMATATALKKAQEFVASHDKWKHPHYWAAWQLWGLPD